MPWAPVDLPALALGVLKNAVATTPGIEVDVQYANLDYADWIVGQREFSYEDYLYFSNETYFLGYGDWVFSSALNDDPAWAIDEFRRDFLSDALYTAHPMGAMSAGGTSQMENAIWLHQRAQKFIRELAESICSGGPDVVGFTTTFQTSVAALAAARQIKRIAPGVVTVFGGANCDGCQGEAIHRNFPFVDFVVRGEGDTTFPQLLTALNGNRDYSRVRGLCWRSDDGKSVSNELATKPLLPTQIVSPNYDGYFERLERSSARTWAEPKLVVEGARGCWWGEKHHCTFCGLNGSLMQFRSKTPQRFFDEIVELTKRHKVLDIFVVDNIIDMQYLSSVLPMIVDSGYDFRIQYEIKANMRRDQLAVLGQSGATVQPGIENLSTHVLKIMRKGVTGCQNIRLLRDVESLGMTPFWNYLYGFPGERAADYSDIISQLPAVHHLFPPTGASRLAIERFSPYFDRPELGFSEVKPDPQYSRNYNLPYRELFDIAYLFTSTPQGIGDEIVRRLNEALKEWKRCYYHSSFTFSDMGNSVLLVNQRAAFAWDTIRLTTPMEVTAFRLLDQPRTIPWLSHQLSDRLAETYTSSDVTALIRRWRGLGIIFEESEHFIHIATEDRNQALLRVHNDGLVEQTAFVDDERMGLPWRTAGIVEPTQLR